MAGFITFEGVEGCGKTTQIRLLAERLMESGTKVQLTREPGGCRISDKIREILLDAGNDLMTSKTELLLYAAARSQHIEEVIRPALSKGTTVLCDRFTDATVAYQGYGRGLDLSLIKELNNLATAGCSPDLTLLIDCEVATGLERALARIEQHAASGASTLREERFERESIEFHSRVREGYLTIAAKEPERFVIIDGRGGIQEVFERVLLALDDRGVF